MGKFVDLTGQKFGRLSVVKRVESVKKGRGAYWFCKCDCGNEVVVRTGNLKGTTKSCGCLHKELSRQKCLNEAKHNMSHTRLYKIWVGIKTRCYNKNSKEYKYYGGRGIKMCNEWENDFLNFYKWAISNGYDNDLSIDRIDNNGSYNPNNCRWANDIEQANNTRNNHYYTINGVTHSIADWLRIFKIPRGVYNSRVYRGWNIGDALTIPKHKYNKTKRGDNHVFSISACSES